MPIKSIVDIEVNDEQFKKFSDLFNSYQELLAKTPDAWDKVSGSTKETSLTTEKMGALLLAQTELSHRMTIEHEKATTSVKEQARMWSDIKKSTEAAASHIMAATKALLRWAELTSVFTGLLGAGGLFGIERLAQSAAGGFRSAAGLGTTFGEQRAFGINFGRLLNPDMLISGVNEALHDVTKRVGLYGAGLTDRDIEGKNTTEVAAEMIPALKRLADQTPDSQMAQVLKSHMLDRFITLEDFERLKATPAGEIGQFSQQYRMDAQRFNLTRDQLKAWTDLTVKLHQAGSSIETILMRDLGRLAQPLGNLSDAFTQLVATFLEAPVVKEWINSLATGIKEFADFLKTPEFKQDVEDFVAGVGRLAHAIVAALEKLGIIQTPEEKANEELRRRGIIGTGGPSDTRPAQGGWSIWGYTPGQDEDATGGGTTPPGAPSTTVPGTTPTPGGAPEVPRAPGDQQPSAGQAGQDQQPVWWNPLTWRWELKPAGPGYYSHPTSPIVPAPPTTPTTPPGAPSTAPTGPPASTVPETPPGAQPDRDVTPRAPLFAPQFSIPRAPGIPPSPLPESPGITQLPLRSVSYHPGHVLPLWMENPAWRNPANPMTAGWDNLFSGQGTVGTVPGGGGISGLGGAGGGTGADLGSVTVPPAPALSGDTAARAEEAYQYFRAQGWSDAAAKAIRGYLGEESKWNPHAFNPDAGGRGAMGAGQWRGPRIANFERLFGHDPVHGTFEEQLAFLQWELTHTEMPSAQRLRQSQSFEDASRAMLGFGRGKASEQAHILSNILRYGQRTPTEEAARPVQQPTTPHPMTHPALSGLVEAMNRGINQGRTGTLVRVQNNTGGNAIVTSSQLVV